MMQSPDSGLDASPSRSSCYNHEEEEAEEEASIAEYLGNPESIHSPWKAGGRGGARVSADNSYCTKPDPVVIQLLSRVSRKEKEEEDLERPSIGVDAAAVVPPIRVKLPAAAAEHFSSSSSGNKKELLKGGRREQQDFLPVKGLLRHLLRPSTIDRYFMFTEISGYSVHMAKDSAGNMKIRVKLRSPGAVHRKWGLRLSDPKTSSKLFRQRSWTTKQLLFIPEKNIRDSPTIKFKITLGEKLAGDES